MFSSQYYGILFDENLYHGSLLYSCFLDISTKITDSSSMNSIYYNDFQSQNYQKLCSNVT